MHVQEVQRFSVERAGRSSRGRWGRGRPHGCWADWTLRGSFVAQLHAAACCCRLRRVDCDVPTTVLLLDGAPLSPPAHVPRRSAAAGRRWAACSRWPRPPATAWPGLPGEGRPWEGPAWCWPPVSHEAPCRGLLHPGLVEHGFGHWPLFCCSLRLSVASPPLPSQARPRQFWALTPPLARYRGRPACRCGGRATAPRRVWNVHRRRTAALKESAHMSLTLLRATGLQGRIDPGHKKVPKVYSLAVHPTR